MDHRIPLHLAFNLTQVEPVRRFDTRRRYFTFPHRSTDGISAHANERREFFDRQMLCFHAGSLVHSLVLRYAEDLALGTGQMSAYVC
jgi:hypothetical protein